MGNWHAPEDGNKERKVQQEKPAAETPGVARSTDGLSNKGLQGVVPGLTLQLKGMGGAVLDDTLARAIHSKRGSGESLDPSTAKNLGESMGHDFSDVNIHRDAESDTLNKQVQAEAFTTGKDVFFSEGKYDPVSNEGQKLLAHELTHVVQQRNAPPAQELRVSDPHEASEQQAHKVADSVTGPGASSGPSAAATSVGREEEEGVGRHAMANAEEDESSYGQTNMATSLAREEGGEEETEEGAATMARQESEEQEDEGVATMARQESEEQEDEGVATQVARQESEEQEDEGVATQVARAESEEQEDEGVATMARQESEEQEDEGVATMVARDHSPEEEEMGAGHAM